MSSTTSQLERRRVVVLVSAGAPVLYLGARFLHKLFFTKRYSAKVLADPVMNSVAVAVHTGSRHAYA